MRRFSMLLPLLAMFLVVAHTIETGATELDQAEAYDVSKAGFSEDFTDLIQEAESAPESSVASVATTAPKAKQVKIVGDTAIDATLRMFSEGGSVLEVIDETNGYGMAFGTNTQQKDHFRFKPIGGDGIAINSKSDKVGLFVDANTGYVGVGHSKPSTSLHVQGTTHSTGTISTTASGDKAALQLSGVEDFKGIQLNSDGSGLYLIGRGKALAERELSFHIPSAADYGGGKEPTFTWSSGSGHDTMATLEAETGNMYIKGRLGIGAMEPKAEIDVHGSVNIENQHGEAIITFPRGSQSGFHIRSTNNPGAYTAADDRLYISGDNGYVGIKTTTPKAMLDVRGALNLADASSSAVIYFPSKAQSSSFFIRCTDDPSQYSKDQERFFIGADGKVGIVTNSPTHGLTISSEAGEGDALNDVAIMKGSLHVFGGIYDTFGGGQKYFIDLKKDAYLKSVNVETMLGVGTKKPVGLPGSNAVVHIQGDAPVMRIENTKADGTAAVSLQTGGNSWDIEGTAQSLAIKNNGKSRLTITEEGRIGIGEQATNPEYGLQIDTDAPNGNVKNDLSISKGNLWMSGEIKQIGNPRYSFSMDKGGLIKELNVEGNIGVGLNGEKPKFALEMGESQTMSLGNQLFFAGANGNAYIGANTYQADGKWALQKSQDGASALTLESSGKIKFEASKKAGEPLLETMFTIDAKSQTATFPMAGLKAGFGTANPQYPLQVNGGTSVGMTKASVAFGMTAASMGYLGSNDKYVYIATSQGKEVISLDHGTGYVGIGTATPQSTLHLASAESPTLSFGSSSQPATHAYIKAEPDGDALNMIFGIKNPTNAGGKLTFDFSNEMLFGGSGPTIFSRGDTIFKSGNVGIGGSDFDSHFRLHVKGDMKIDGKVFVSAKRPSTVPGGDAAPKKDKGAETDKPTDKAEQPEQPEQSQDGPKDEAPLDAAKETPKGGDEDLSTELDFTDLLELEEGRTENLSEHGIDLSETLHGLTRILRKQHRRMDAHDQRIDELQQQLAMAMQR